MKLPGILSGYLTVKNKDLKFLKNFKILIYKDICFLKLSKFICVSRKTKLINLIH